MAYDKLSHIMIPNSTKEKPQKQYLFLNQQECMFKNTYHKRSQLVKGIEHLHSLYDSRHCKQHLLFSEFFGLFFFFFFSHIRQDRFGWKEHQIQ